MTKTLAILGILITSIWFGGAAIMMGVYEYDRRSECIQNEGLLKGLLWCKTDYKSREELGVGHAVLVTKAMGWPLYFFRSSENFNEEINEELKKIEVIDYESVFEECGFDSKSITSIAKECVLKKSNQLAGKATYREAYCQREASTYESFAQVRDSGVSLNPALQAVDKFASKKMQELSSKSGVELNKNQVVEEANQIMRYVYSHPGKSPALLSYEHYHDCISK